MSVCSDMTKLRGSLIFDANCSSWALRVLKYLNCLHELQLLTLLLLSGPNQQAKLQ